MEQLLASCCVRIHDLVEEWKTSKTNQKKILPMLQKYYPGRFDNMTLEEVIKMHDTTKLSDMYYMNVGSYSSYTPEKVDRIAEELGVTAQSKILIPTNTVADLKELKENLSEQEYDEVVKGMEGKYTEIEKPLSVGMMNLIELEMLELIKSFKLLEPCKRNQQTVCFNDCSKLLIIQSNLITH